jgi:hypothetical protein
MKNFKRIIFILLIFVVAFSCNNKCDDTSDQVTMYIPDSIRLELNQDDSLIYQSNLGNFDTLVITEKLYLINDSIRIAPIESRCYESTKGEIIRCMIKYKDSTNYYISQEFITYPNTGFLYNFKEFKKVEEVQYLIRRLSGLNEYQLNDSIYKYVFFWEEQCYFGSTTDFSVITLNHKYGIIQYKNCSGEEFTLFKYVKSTK